MGLMRSTWTDPRFWSEKLINLLIDLAVIWILKLICERLSPITKRLSTLIAACSSSILYLTCLILNAIYFFRHDPTDLLYRSSLYANSILYNREKREIWCVLNSKSLVGKCLEISHRNYYHAKIRMSEAILLTVYGLLSTLLYLLLVKGHINSMM